MTKEELEDLIEEIRLGRQEDVSLDWKRQWYNFSITQNQNEFIKDITAFANAITETERRRIIIGIKGGKLHNAPISCDEADLQQRLERIEPRPHVSFQTFDVEGNTLSVIEIGPPFDPPYVAKIDNIHCIWVRSGSSTITASRKLIDRLYQKKGPAPELDFVWLQREEDDTPILARPLEIPAHSINVAQMRSQFEKRMARMCPDPAKLRIDDRYDAKTLAKYEGELEFANREADEFFTALSDSGNFNRQYAQRNWEKDAFEVALLVNNTGEKKAKNIRFQVELPSWLLIGMTNKPIDEWLIPLFEPTELPKLPAPPQPKEEPEEAGDDAMSFPRRQIGDLTLSGLGGIDILAMSELLSSSFAKMEYTRPAIPQNESFRFTMPELPEIKSIFDRDDFKIEPERISGEVHEIRHKDNWFSDFFFLLAAPSAPVGEHSIPIKFISDEYPDYRETELVIRVVDASSEKDMCMPDARHAPKLRVSELNNDS